MVRHPSTEHLIRTPIQHATFTECEIILNLRKQILVRFVRCPRPRCHCVIQITYGFGLLCCTCNWTLSHSVGGKQVGRSSYRPVTFCIVYILGSGSARYSYVVRFHCEPRSSRAIQILEEKLQHPVRDFPCLL